MQGVPDIEATDPRREQIEQLLSRGPMSAAELTSRLGVSQPTLSRTIRALGDELVAFRVKGIRTPRYALLRPLPFGVASRQPVYRIDERGQVQSSGTVALLKGGSVVRELADGEVRLHDGLPPSMAFAAPAGFLGRLVAHAAARLRMSPRPQDWSDDQKALWLFMEGADLPGDRIFGDEALEHAMRSRRALKPIVPAMRVARWHETIEHLASVPAGSSAGGEWPKFLACVEGRGHLIVKFARAGTRAGELLKLEHLALRSLAEAGVPAAATTCVENRGMTFLEVERFDRVGHHGRSGVITAGALDDEHFGRRDHWSSFADRAVQARWLRPEQARPIHVMEAFSELVGNTDRHFENLSLRVDAQDRITGVAPAYDLLPMKYASIGGAVDPPLHPVTPRLGAVGGRPFAWDLATRAALAFWESVRTGRFECDGRAVRIGNDFRELAARNVHVVREFAEPLASGVHRPPPSRA